MLKKAFSTFFLTNKQGFNKIGGFQFISSTIIVYICQDFKKNRGYEHRRRQKKDRQGKSYI